MIKKCTKTTSGRHKWGKYYDGFDEKKTKKATDKYKNEGHNPIIIFVPKIIKKCQACGLYQY